MRRYVVAAVVLALFAVMPACKDDPSPTEIDVQMFSSVGHLERLHLMVRDQTVDRDRGYTWAELDVTDIADRDLTTNPALVRLAESDALKGKPFLLYVTGYGPDTTGATRLLAAGAITLEYVEKQRQNKSVRLSGDFLITDKDNDGFRKCGSFQLATDPAEQGVLEESKNCDCADTNDRINPFNFEICGDNADNNCTGWPYDENCTDCVEDQPCTDLTLEQSVLAGIGECTLGVRKCAPVLEAGVSVKRLAEACVGAKGPVAEGTAADGKDNDCDGVVDEGTACLPGTLPRPCYLGFIDNQATVKALGECRSGLQACSSGTWENDCVGQVKPQRPPKDITEQETADPRSWTGIGFFELSISSRALDQCDGKDNDCDGLYDEELSFDFDQDGYTYCGTNDAPPAVNPPRAHALPGVSPINIDCNDNNADVHPGAVERCDDSIDNDCSCDHGPAISGSGGVVSGVDCFTPDTYLDCSRTERVSSPSGTCDELAGGVFYTGYGNSSGANRRYGCFPCRAGYGLTCAASGDTCSAKAEGCCVANACPSGSLTDDGDGTHAGAVFRPYCAEPDAGTCNCTVGPSWHSVAAGSEPNAGGVLLDDRDDCGAIDCTPYFLGVNAGDGRCYTRADIGQAAAFCLGKPLCAPGDTSPGCCNGDTGANCCETPADRCPGQATQGPEFAVPRAICQQVQPGTCTGQTSPTYQPVPVNTDPFNDCAGPLNCNGNGACLKNIGDGCGGTSECNTGATCVDGVCCGSNSCGTCQACNVPGSLGTCAGITGDADPGTCDTQCTSCVAGSCVTRGSNDNTECGTCQMCNGGNGACSAVSAAEGKGCNNTCTECNSGLCQTRPPNENDECGTCQRCDGSATSCQAVTAAEGNGCNGACSQCNAGACQNRNANDPSECGTCQACNAPGGSCTGISAFEGNSCTGGCSQCVTGSCQTRGPGTSPECGTCNTCDGSQTNCQAVTAPEGFNCNGACTQCNAGLCQGRGNGDATECGTCATCQAGACAGSNSPGGNNCNGAGQFCCGVTCTSPGGSAELNQSCGTGGCSGLWICSGTTGICSAMGNECDTCTNDTINNKTCDADGNCQSGTNVDCFSCQTCQLGSGVGNCVDRSAGDDNQDPMTCNGSNTCDDSGNCLADLGSSCSSNGACASGCCGSGSTCNGSGTCRQPLGDSCSSNGACVAGCCGSGSTCNGSGTCRQPLGDSCSSNGACVAGCCGSGSTCNGSGTCRLPLGASCSSNGACVAGCCGPGCGGSGTCRIPNGGACSNSSDCANLCCDDNSMGSCNPPGFCR